MRGTIQGVVAVAAICVAAIFAVFVPAAPGHAMGPGVSVVSGASGSFPTWTGQNGQTMSTATAGEFTTSARVRADGGFRVGGILAEFNTGGILFTASAAPIISAVGTAATTIEYRAKSGNAANVVSHSFEANTTGVVNILGTGIVQWPTDGVNASNALTGATGGACAAAGDVGKLVRYQDTSTSKITFCVCEQTAAATFAWGAVTGAGDCT